MQEPVRGIGKRRVSAHTLVTAALAAALVASWVRPLAGQGTAPPPVLPGGPAAPSAAYRYQLAVFNSDAFAVIDTHTGHVWTKNVAVREWRDHGVPPGAKAD